MFFADTPLSSLAMGGRGIRVVRVFPVFRRDGMNDVELRDRAAALLISVAQTFGNRGELLLRHVLAGFLPMVLDLPASERHHHRWPFGLVDHSLEVALGALSRIHAAARRSERVCMLLAPTLVVALLHDLGKVFDVDRSSPGQFTWRRGRGFVGHPAQAELILTLVPSDWTDSVKAIAERYDDRFRRPRPPDEPPLDFLVDSILRADGQSAWFGQRERGPYLRQLISSLKGVA